MKRVLYILLFISIFIPEIKSQDNPSFAPENSQSNEENPCVVQEVKSYAWQLTPSLFNREFVEQDTVFLDYYKTDVEDYM